MCKRLVDDEKEFARALRDFARGLLSGSYFLSEVKDTLIH